MLSLHFLRAGDHEQAWRYARLAARSRRASSSPTPTRRELYRRALDAARARRRAAAASSPRRGRSSARRIAHTGEPPRRSRPSPPRAAGRATTRSRTRRAPAPPRRAGRPRRPRRARGALGATAGCGSSRARPSRAPAPAARSAARRAGHRAPASGPHATRPSSCAAGAIAEAEARRRGRRAGGVAATLVHPRLGAVESGRPARGRRTPPRALEIYGGSATSTVRPRCSTTWAASRTARAAGTTRSALYARREREPRAGDVANAAFGDCNVGEVLSTRGGWRRPSSCCGGRGASGAARATTGASRSRPRCSGAWRSAPAATTRGTSCSRTAPRCFQRLPRSRTPRWPTACIAEALAFARAPDARAGRGRPRAPRAGRSTALLHRVRGFALAQLGDEDGAAHAFHASLREAEERGNRYELAVTLHALDALPRSAPARRAGGLRRRDALLAQLGVVALPAPPLSAAWRDRRPAAAPG